jgi:hypothetical protein
VRKSKTELTGPTVSVKLRTKFMSQCLRRSRSAATFCCQKGGSLSEREEAVTRSCKELSYHKIVNSIIHIVCFSMEGQLIICIIIPAFRDVCSSDLSGPLHLFLLIFMGWYRLFLQFCERIRRNAGGQKILFFKNGEIILAWLMLVYLREKKRRTRR